MGLHTLHLTSRTSEAGLEEEALWEQRSSPDKGPEKAASCGPRPEGLKARPTSCSAAGPITPQAIMNANEDDYLTEFVTSVGRPPPRKLSSEEDNQQLGETRLETHSPRLRASGNPIRPASPSPQAHRWRQLTRRSPPTPSWSFPVGSPVDHWLFKRWNS